MAHRLRRSLSFANVCSLLALFVALSTGGAYAANTVFSTDIVDGEVKTEDLALGAVALPQLASNAVNSARVDNGSLKGIDLEQGAVGAREIADESVTGAEIGPGAAGGTEIADGAVGANHVADGSLGQPDLGFDSVAASEIADGSIDSGEIINDSLFASDLGAGAVGTSELATNAVTSDKVVNNALTASDVKGAYGAGSVGFSANAVPNGRCRDFGISVPGARPGEAVVVSTRGALPEGLMFYSVGVASNDVVTMKYCNFSGAATPALDSVPIRTITFG